MSHTLKQTMVKQKKRNRNKNTNKNRNNNNKKGEVDYSDVVWLLYAQLSRVFEDGEPILKADGGLEFGGMLFDSWMELYSRLIDIIVNSVPMKECLSSESVLEQYVAARVDKDTAMEGLEVNDVLKKLKSYVKMTFPARLKEFVEMWIDPAGYSVEGLSMALDPFSDNLSKLQEWLVEGGLEKERKVKFEELNGVFNPNDADARDAYDLVDVLKENGICQATESQPETNPLAMVGRLVRLNGLFETYSHLKRRQRALKNLRSPNHGDPLIGLVSVTDERVGYDLLVPEEGVFGKSRSSASTVRHLKEPIDDQITWIVAIVPDRQGAYYRARNVANLKDEVDGDPQAFDRKHLPEAINGDETNAKFFACYHYEIRTGDDILVKTAAEWDDKVKTSKQNQLDIFDKLEEIPLFSGLSSLKGLKRAVAKRPTHENEQKVYHSSDRFFDEFSAVLQSQYGHNALYIFGDGTDNPHPSTERTMILQAWITGLQKRSLNASFINDQGVSIICSSCLYPTVQRGDSSGKSSQYYCVNSKCGKEGRECICACECVEDDCKVPGEARACITRHCSRDNCESITGSFIWDYKADFITSNLVYLAINTLLGKERPHVFEFTYQDNPLTMRDLVDVFTDQF